MRGEIEGLRAQLLAAKSKQPRTELPDPLSKTAAEKSESTTVPEDARARKREALLQENAALEKLIKEREDEIVATEDGIADTQQRVKEVRAKNEAWEEAYKSKKRRGGPAPSSQGPVALPSPTSLHADVPVFEPGKPIALRALTQAANSQASPFDVLMLNGQLGRRAQSPDA